jgi:tetratricopeptide (TPR) repeat protein
VAVAAAWLASSVLAGKYRKALAPASLLLLSLLAVTTRHQLAFWKDGVTLFGAGLEANGGDPRFVGQYVDELVHAGRLPEAREALAPLLPHALDPGVGVAIQLRHLSVLDALGDRAGAIEAARGYLGRDPGFWKTRLLLADHLLAEGRYGEAEGEYRTVLALGEFPSRERAHALEGLGIALAETGRGAAAEEKYLEGLAVNPLSVPLHFNLALQLSAGGDPARAAAHFVEALRLSPGNPRVLLALAEHLLRAGDPAGAAACFQEVEGRYPGSAEAFLARGRLLEAAGRGAEAREAYRAAAAGKALLPETPDGARKRLGGAP